MEPTKLYHEKQVKQLCALHCLNSLFKNVHRDSSCFSQMDLDAICQTLSPGSRIFNPHKSSLGLGNYDVNVIMSAVQQRGCEAIWFDRRKNPEHLVFSKILGFILNIPNPSYQDKWSSMLTLPIHFIMSKKHWISIVKHSDDSYYNLDSKLESPAKIGQEPELIVWLKEKNEANDCEIFVIVEKEVAEQQIWFQQHN